MDAIDPGNGRSPSFSRTMVRLAWLALVIALAFLAATLSAHLTVCAQVFLGITPWGWLPANLSTVGFGVLGVLIITRQPHNRIGWLCVAIAALISPFLGPSTVFLN